MSPRPNMAEITAKQGEAIDSRYHPSAAVRRQLNKVFPTLDCSSCICTPRMAEAAHHPRIQLQTWSEVKRVERDGDGFRVEVRNAAGKLIATFTSVWRQESPGVWRIVFDKGNEVCDCAKAP